MDLQDKVGKAIDDLESGTGHHPTIIAELREVWGVLDGGYTEKELAALIEEMLSKGYDQMKARTLTAVEAATGQSDIGSKPLGRQIGYALDDAKRVTLDVLKAKAPEITPVMLAEAGKARRDAEAEAAAEAQTEFLEETVLDLRSRLESAERRLAEDKKRRLRMEIHAGVQRAPEAALAGIAEALRNGIQLGRTSG